MIYVAISDKTHLTDHERQTTNGRRGFPSSILLRVKQTKMGAQKNVQDAKWKWHVLDVVFPKRGYYAARYPYVKPNPVLNIPVHHQLLVLWYRKTSHKGGYMYIWKS